MKENVRKNEKKNLEEEGEREVQVCERGGN